MLNRMTRAQRGSVLYTTVLLVSVVLAISIGVSTIAEKEAIFSSFGRDSQKAFFAADSGLECAMYHDFKRYSPDSAFPANDTESLQTTNCFQSLGGGIIGAPAVVAGPNYATTTM